MKTLFVYKYLTLGGVETVLRSRLDSLNRFGVEAQAWFLSDGPGRSIFSGIEEQITVGDVNSLESHLRDVNYDVISSVDTVEVFSSLSRINPRPKIVVEVHSPYRENLEYLRSLRSVAVAAYFSPSAYQARIARKILGNNNITRIIPNPLQSVFVEEPTAFEPTPQRPVVAWIGRLDGLKNWEEFVHVAGWLGRTGHNLEFWIVGNSAEPRVGERLYALARKVGVLSRLLWFKGVLHQHIPAVLDAIRESGGVVVSTSRGESFGMTIAEAMARQCAVVAPAHGPFAEYVEHGQHGFLYKLGSAKDAAAKIGLFLADARLRVACGQKARQRILARHAPQYAIQTLAHELNRCLLHAQ